MEKKKVKSLPLPDLLMMEAASTTCTVWINVRNTNKADQKENQTEKCHRKLTILFSQFHHRTLININVKQQEKSPNNTYKITIEASNSQKYQNQVDFWGKLINTPQNASYTITNLKEDPDPMRCNDLCFKFVECRET